MASKIPVSDYKSIGFKTKKEALTYAKKYNLAPIRGDLDKFLFMLKEVHNRELSLDIINEKIQNKVVKFNNFETDKIFFKNDQQYEIKLFKTKDQVHHFRVNYTIDDIINLCKKVGRKPDHLPMITLKYITASEYPGKFNQKINYKIINEKLINELIRQKRVNYESGEGYEDITAPENLLMSITVEWITRSKLRKVANKRTTNEKIKSRNIIKQMKQFKDRSNETKTRREVGFVPYLLKQVLFSEEILEELRLRYQLYTRIVDDNSGAGVFDPDTFEITMGKTFDKIANLDENCFVHALRLCGVDKGLVNELSINCRNSYVPYSCISEFAKNKNLNIKISEPARTLTFGNRESKEIHIGSVSGHCFIHEKTGIARYPFMGNNIEDVLGKNEWWKITKLSNNYFRREKTPDKFLNTVQLFQALENNYKKYKGTKYCLTDPMIMDEKVGLLIENRKIDKTIMNLSKNIEVAPMLTKEQKRQEQNNITKTKIKYHKKYTVEEKDEKIKRFDMVDEYFKNKRKWIHIGFDFETNTRNKHEDTLIHKEYLVSYKTYLSTINLKEDEIITDTTHIIGKDCATRFLQYCCNISKEQKKRAITELLKDNKLKLTNKEIIRYLMYFFKVRIVAHNLSYDIQFLLKHVEDINICKRGSSNSVCGGSFVYMGQKIELLDSYAVLDCKLDSFGDNFGIKLEKEVIPYGVYNSNENLYERNYISIRKAKNILIKELKKKMLTKIEIAQKVRQFKANITSWDLKNKDGTYDHMKYAAHYCDRDVEVMLEGYLIFRGWVKTDFNNVELFDFLTISSISTEYFTKEGAFEDCYKKTGIARHFEQQSVVGGRCASRSNKKYKINKKLNDLDAVGLYASAQMRLAAIGGFLKGKPKVLENDQLNFEFLEKTDGYFIEIILPEIKKHLKFPLVSYKNEDGIRIFDNGLKETKKDGSIFYHNKMTLNKIDVEDLLRFHEVKKQDIKIIKGTYYDQGRNSKIGEVIQYLHDKRVELKKQKKPIQSLYKLLMNSIYGKTILKPITDKTTYKHSKEEMKDYMILNHNKISECTKVLGSDTYRIDTIVPFIKHSNLCHIGSEILSMSKRIMNEVMCLAEELNIEIYYQDTDSMHIIDEDIPRLAAEYKKKYGRELIGKNMGQFHCDFAPYKKPDGKFLDGENSVESIILGKKAYIDRVIHLDFNESSGSLDPYYSIHFRMKGCPQDVIIKHAKENYRKENIDYDDETKETYGCDLMALYQDLYEGSTIIFDLLSCGVKFKTNRNHTVTTKTSFPRSVKF